MAQRKKKKSKKESKRAKSSKGKSMKVGRASVSALKRTGPRSTKKATKKKGTYIGFKKLAKATSPAIAAAIGRKKYGKKAFQKAN